MQNTITNSSPRIKLADSEQLDVGVMIRKILLPEQQEELPPFKSTVFEVAPGCSSPIDHHVVKECWIILKGYGDLHYNGKHFKAAAQDIFYFEPHHTHQILNDNDELLVICSIYW